MISPIEAKKPIATKPKPMALTITSSRKLRTHKSLRESGGLG